MIEWLSGDSITFENEPTKYRVSELLFQDKNIPFACDNEVITIGRMKGKIAPGDKIYKIGSKTLSNTAKSTYSGAELKKINLNCKITIKKDSPITVFVKPDRDYDIYKNVSVKLESNIYPEAAINQPITKEKIIAQFSKTNDTPFVFDSFDIELEDNLYIPKISEINALRREVLERLETLISRKFTRVPIDIKKRKFNEKIHTTSPKISLLLRDLNINFDYSTLEDVDRVYIPLNFFNSSKYQNCIDDLNTRFDTYIYMPSIITSNYSNIMNNIITKALSTFKITGFVFSNIRSLHTMKLPMLKKYDHISNYTLNVFNDYSAYELSRIGVKTVTLSPELNKEDIQNMTSDVNKELIVYGRIRLMTSKYCLLGNSNNCYPKCELKCQEKGKKYYLKDRMGFSFRVIPDSLQTVTSIYNSKILSTSFNDLNIDYARIDILDEDISEINKIIKTVKSGKRLEGPDYTNGHLSRNV